VTPALDAVPVAFGERLTDAATASYPILVLAVLVGAIVPVIPTGAVVSGAAVIAYHQGGVSLAVVVGLAAAAAFGGDCAVYAAFRTGRRGVASWPGTRWFAGETRGARLADTKRRLREHGTALLVVSRLIPGGRIPTLLAASALHYPWSRFLVGGAIAAAVWAALYAALGLLGGSAFANPLVGVLAAVIAVLAVSGILRLVQRWVAVRPDSSPVG
jgi:membrane protein DedA with SNARE-associated domain